MSEEVPACPRGFGQCGENFMAHFSSQSLLLWGHWLCSKQYVQILVIMYSFHSVITNTVPLNSMEFFIPAIEHWSKKIPHQKLIQKTWMECPGVVSEE